MSMLASAGRTGRGDKICWCVCLVPGRQGTSKDLGNNDVVHVLGHTQKRLHEVASFNWQLPRRGRACLQHASCEHACAHDSHGIDMHACAGRLNGKFSLHSYDAATWRLPSFGGKLKARGGSFHLWDATDDFSDVTMDLLFEHDRLYMHNARGLFGAVPMTLTGAHATPGNHYNLHMMRTHSMCCHQGMRPVSHTLGNYDRCGQRTDHALAKGTANGMVLLKGRRGGVVWAHGMPFDMPIKLPGAKCMR